MPKKDYEVPSKAYEMDFWKSGDTGKWLRYRRFHHFDSLTQRGMGE